MRVILIFLLLFSCASWASEEVFSRFVSAINSENQYNLETLLAEGVTPNVIDEFGRTPLMVASLSNNFKAAKLLVDSGANYKAKDEGGATALSYAVRGDAKGIAALLLALGLNPTAEDKIGLSPLKLARSLKLAEMEEILSIQVEAQKIERHESKLKQERYNERPVVKHHPKQLPSNAEKPKGLVVGEAVMLRDSHETKQEITIDAKAYTKSSVQISGFKDMDHFLNEWDIISKQYTTHPIRASINEHDECAVVVDGMEKNDDDANSICAFARSRGLTCTKRDIALPHD